MSKRTRYFAGGIKNLPPGNNRAEEYDSVAGTFTTWDTNGVQTSSRSLTPAEAAALDAEDTLAASVSNADTLRQRAQAALAANATFQALGAPTNAQVVAQVQLLTRECNALIRLALSAHDSTSGT